MALSLLLRFRDSDDVSFSVSRKFSKHWTVVGSTSSMRWCNNHSCTRAQQLLRWATVWPQFTWAEKLRRLLCPFPWRELSPHLTQCRQGRGLPPYQVTSWCIQPFGHNIPTLQTDRTDRQDRHGPMAQGEPLLAQKSTWLRTWNRQADGQRLRLIPLPHTHFSGAA